MEHEFDMANGLYELGWSDAEFGWPEYSPDVFEYEDAYRVYMAGYGDYKESIR